MTKDEEIRVLRAALKPFAEYADRYNEIPGVCLTHDNVELWQNGHDVELSVGDLRRARSARNGEAFIPTPLPRAALSASPAPVSRPEYPGNIGPFASPAPDPAPNDATRLARAFNAWTPPAPDPAEATLANADQIEFEAGILLEQRAKAAEAMRDGAIYAAVSRAKDPEGYDKMLDEVTADARAVLAAEAMRAKCEAIARDMRGWMQPRDVADAIAALKGNREGR